MKACIVIPTYNEAKNIVPLLDEILQNARMNRKHNISILVVDDNSPDGTSRLVRAYHDDRVHLLLRKEKQGLGAAYIAGFKHALKKFNPDVIMEMDADFSHDPKDIFRLLQAAEQADFVIGSRYADGGATKDWPLHRKVISGTAGRLTRAMLGLSDVKDTTGGFRAIRAHVFEAVDLDKLDVKGYAFQISLLYAAVRQGFKVAEVPIVFSERREGESKMGFNDVAEFGMFVMARGSNRLVTGDGGFAAVK